VTDELQWPGLWFTATLSDPEDRDRGRSALTRAGSRSAAASVASTAFIDAVFAAGDGPSIHRLDHLAACLTNVAGTRTRPDHQDKSGVKVENRL
jgi:hypothetical protein